MSYDLSANPLGLVKATQAVMTEDPSNQFSTQTGSATKYIINDQTGAKRVVDNPDFNSLGIDPSKIQDVGNFDKYFTGTSGANVSDLNGFVNSQLGDINTTQANQAKVLQAQQQMAAAGQSITAPANPNLGMGGLDANGKPIIRQADPAAAAAQAAQPNTTTLANGHAPGGLQMPQLDGNGNPIPTGLSFNEGQAANAANPPKFDAQGNLIPGTGGASAAGLAAAQASGQKAPQDSASASNKVQGFTDSANPQNIPNVKLVNQTLQNDPGYQQLLTDANAAKSTAATSETLTKQYQDLLNQYNIPGLNTELLNDQRIINGTEDDIRHEVTAAGGFATDSQVLGLATARNKTLIQNYNNLLATKNDAMSQINTLSGLQAQDKQFAQQSANNQLQIDSQIADYTQKFQANAQTAYNNVISAVGYVGLFQSLQSDPSSISLAEQTLGLTPGSLQQLAAQQYQQQQAAAQTAQLDLANKQAQLAQTQAQTQATTQQTALNLANAPLDAKAKQAQINASNASAASSSASAAKTQADLAFQKANGGMTQAEVQQQQIAEDSKIQNFQKDAGGFITQLDANKITWGAAWNALHSEYPDASTQTIDNALDATNYRNSAHGG